MSNFRTPDGENVDTTGYKKFQTAYTDANGRIEGFTSGTNKIEKWISNDYTSMIYSKIVPILYSMGYQEFSSLTTVNLRTEAAPDTNSGTTYSLPVSNNIKEAFRLSDTEVLVQLGDGSTRYSSDNGATFGAALGSATSGLLCPHNGTVYWAFGNDLKYFNMTSKTVSTVSGVFSGSIAGTGWTHYWSYLDGATLNLVSDGTNLYHCLGGYSDDGLGDTPPTQVILRSSDNGATWSFVAAIRKDDGDGSDIIESAEFFGIRSGQPYFICVLSSEYRTSLCSGINLASQDTDTVYNRGGLFTTDFHSSGGLAIVFNNDYSDFFAYGEDYNDNYYSIGSYQNGLRRNEVINLCNLLNIPQTEIYSLYWAKDSTGAIYAVTQVFDEDYGTYPDPQQLIVKWDSIADTTPTVVQNFGFDSLQRYIAPVTKIY